MDEPIITQAIKEDLPTILDVQRKAFLEVARTFHLKTMPQIEQTLESLTDEFNNCIFLKASLIEKHGNAITNDSDNFKLKQMSFRTYVRNLKALNLLKSRFLASLRNDTKRITARFLRGNDVADVTIVGSVRAYAKGDTCYISRLVVLPDYQNKGIGKALMKEIEKLFRNSVRRYELFTGSRDERNLYLYNQLGYKSFKTEKLNHGYKPHGSIRTGFFNKLWGLIPSALRDCSTSQFRRAPLPESEFHNNEITFVFMEKSAR